MRCCPKRPKAHAPPPRVELFDFESMYTNLKQEDIIKAHKRGLDLIEARIKRINQPGNGKNSHGRFLEFTIDSHTAEYTCKWTDDDPASPTVTDSSAHVLILTLQSYHEYFTFVIKHAFFTYAGVLYLQHCGIPMGVEPGVLIANNTMWGYEYAFIERLITNKEFNLLGHCRWVGRYIDDLIALNMTHFSALRYIEDKFRSRETGKWVKGLYPRGTTADPILKLKKEDSLVKSNGQPSSIAFLDLAIDWDDLNKLIKYKTYDKRSDTKYNLTRLARLPSPYTLLWPTCLEGVITSELHRFLATCSSQREFYIATAKSVYEMYRNGFNWEELVRKVANFVEFKEPPPPHVRWTSNNKRKRDPTGPTTHLNCIKQGVYYFVQNGHPELDHRNHELQFVSRFYQHDPPPGYVYSVQYQLPH